MRLAQRGVYYTHGPPPWHTLALPGVLSVSQVPPIFVLPALPGPEVFRVLDFSGFWNIYRYGCEVSWG